MADVTQTEPACTPRTVMQVHRFDHHHAFCLQVLDQGRRSVRSSLLDLRPSGYASPPCQFAQADHGRSASNRWALPMNGIMWCSHMLLKLMSRTSTTSSYFSVKNLRRCRAILVQAAEQLGVCPRAGAPTLRDQATRPPQSGFPHALDPRQVYAAGRPSAGSGLRIRVPGTVSKRSDLESSIKSPHGWQDPISRATPECRVLRETAGGGQQQPGRSTIHLSPCRAGRPDGRIPAGIARPVGSISVDTEVGEGRGHAAGRKESAAAKCSKRIRPGVGH